MPSPKSPGCLRFPREFPLRSLVCGGRCVASRLGHCNREVAMNESQIRIVCMIVQLLVELLTQGGTR